MLAVVGVGIARGHLTERGKKLIEEADVVYGSKKAIDLVRDVIKGEVVVLRRFDEEVYREIEKAGREKNVVVLSTGDPMVSGLGLRLRADVIESGISSVLVALARLGKDLCDVVVVDCHASDFEECLEELERVLEIRPALVLVTRGFDVSELRRRLKVRVIVLENLCGDEKVGEANCVKSNDAILYVFRESGRI